MYKRIKLDPTNGWYIHKAKKRPIAFSDANGSPNPTQKTRLSVDIQEKVACYLVDFAVLADIRMKIKESEKINKDLDLARELEKKLCNMKVTRNKIVIGGFGTVLNEEVWNWTSEEKSKPYKPQRR